MHSQAYLWSFFCYGFRRAAVFRSAWTASIISAGFQVTIVVSVWTALYASGVEAQYSFEQVISYGLFTLFVWISIDTRVVRDIERDVREGLIERALLRPISVPGAYFATALGKVSFNMTVLTPAFVFLVFLWQPASMPAMTIGQIAFAATSIVGTIVLVVLIDLCVGLSSFWTINVFGIDMIKENAIRLLSGATVPIFFYPEFLQSIIGYLPFSVMFFQPANLFVAQADAAAYLALLTQQVFWITFMVAIAAFIATRIRKVTTIAGG